jgi:hypothetical protein
MPLFSTQDITWMQNLANQALTDSCDILDKTSTSDNQGGKNSPNWSPTATVPCAVVDNGLSAQELYINAQQRGRIVKTVLVPAGTQVKDNNRLKINNVYYEVLDNADPTTDEVVRRIVVVKLGQGAV